MKTKQLLAVAMCSAVAFVSCEKANVNAPVIGNGEPIDLVMKLGDITSTRAVQPNPGSSIPPELGDGVVFFYGDDGTIWGYEDIDTDKIKTTQGQLFTSVSANASDVYVVGNLPDGVKDELVKATTISELKNKAISIEKQNNGTLAKDVFLANASNVGVSGKEDFDGSIKQVSDNSYEAKVLLRPVLSRLQFYDIKTNDKRIKSFDVAGVYVDNYYPDFTPSSTENVASTLFTVGSSSSRLGSGSPLLYDVVSSPIESGNDYSVSAADFNSSANVFAYHVTPLNDASKGNYVPSLIVKLTNIQYEVNGVTKTINNGYLTVSRYKDNNGNEIPTFKAGNVYNIPMGSFIFDLSNITDEPNMSDVDLTVYVTVLDWTVNDVSPLF